MIRKLYPGGKSKAFNVTYDDGVLQDVRFVELLNKYGVKGTFNLNSNLMWQEFEWTHECGMVVKRLPEHVVRDLYQGHEGASHTLNHPYMFYLSEDDVMREVAEDKANLQHIFGKEIPGFAVPFDYYSDLIAACVEKAGFEYARISEESYSYKPQTDYYHCKAGVFHLSPGWEQFVEGFFQTQEELAVCQIVGHTYDFDAEQMWDKIEKILKRVSLDTDVACMTHIELVRYWKAMDKAIFQNGILENHSEMDLWFQINDKKILLHPGETWDFGFLC